MITLEEATFEQINEELSRRSPFSMTAIYSPKDYQGKELIVMGVELDIALAVGIKQVVDEFLDAAKSSGATLPSPAARHCQRSATAPTSTAS